MTHTDLVVRASKWLRNYFHCRVVLHELVALTNSCETPDAIGWVNNKSILVECKRTRSDFYADRKKYARRIQGWPALGHWRFYLALPDVIPVDKLPGGWGLYEVHGKRIVYKAGVEYRNASHPPFESDRESEVAMLVSALSRPLTSHK